MSIDEAIILARDSDPIIRKSVINSLIKIGGEEAKSIILQLTTDHDKRVRDSANKAIINWDNVER